MVDSGAAKHSTVRADDQNQVQQRDLVCQLTSMVAWGRDAAASPNATLMQRSLAEIADLAEMQPCKLSPAYQARPGVDKYSCEVSAEAPSRRRRRVQ